jgi:signal transduction histidine kinase
MKLLTKNTIVVLAITLTVFLAGGFVFYFQLRAILDEEAGEALLVEKHRLLEYIRNKEALPEALSSEFTFRRSPTPVVDSFSDTIIRQLNEDEEMEDVPFRQLHFNVSLNGENYQGTARKSLIESDDLAESITASLLLISGVLLVLLIVVSVMFSRKMWKPFFETLVQIKSYNPVKQEVITALPAHTTEFRQLREAIATMTEKIANDFKNLKDFTENAAHELQTPVAIIQHKTELLLQHENLDEIQTGQLHTIRETAVRLGKLTQTLLLLTKIENNQFRTETQVDFKAHVTQRMEELEELLQMKNLQVTTALNNEVTIKLHPALADVVISNLLGNALKYTESGGQLQVMLSADVFTVKNTATQPIEHPEKLTERFYKEQGSSSSTGLGLALVNQVAIMNGHRFSYQAENGLHVFSYHFR